MTKLTETLAYAIAVATVLALGTIAVSASNVSRNCTLTQFEGEPK